jgi:Zn-dependent protease with chaperone function
MYELLERNAWATGALLAVMAACAFGFCLAFTRAFGWPDPYALVLATLLATALVAMYLVGDRGVFRTVGPKVSEHPARRRAREVLSEAAVSAGMAEPALILLDTDAVNSASMGRTPERRTILTTTGAVDGLKGDELRAIFAHELAHIRGEDTSVYPIMWVVGRVSRFLLGAVVLTALEVLVLVGISGDEEFFTVCTPLMLVVSFVILFKVPIQMIGAGTGPKARQLAARALARVFMFVGVLWLITVVHLSSPLGEVARSGLFRRTWPALLAACALLLAGSAAGRLAQVAFARTREYVADATAAMALRDPLSLARALISMDARLNTVDGAHPASSHMYMMPPEGPFTRPILEMHPSVPSRLERLRMANPTDPELAELVGGYFERRAAARPVS